LLPAKTGPPARLGDCLGYHLIGLLLLLLPAAPPSAQETLPAAIEYQIKASFVYTVAKFVDWPADSFPAPGKPLTLGIVGDPAVSEAIASALRGKRVHDRDLVVKRLPDLGSLRSCQIVYISGDEKESLVAVLEQVAAAGVLTVGEGVDFAPSGGILGLSLRDSLVQFEVNLAAAQRAGLNISSKILRLGHVVKEERAPGGNRP
jgi:YfiR/HmsC-like